MPNVLHKPAMILKYLQVIMIVLKLLYELRKESHTQNFKYEQKPITVSDMNKKKLIGSITYQPPFGMKTGRERPVEIENLRKQKQQQKQINRMAWVSCVVQVEDTKSTKRTINTIRPITLRYPILILPRI